MGEVIPLRNCVRNKRLEERTSAAKALMSASAPDTKLFPQPVKLVSASIGYGTAEAVAFLDALAVSQIWH
jgi:hypothetical protein